MSHYHEEEAVHGRLFDPEVAKMLWKYVYRHKRYLVISLGFVAVITAATLSIPYLARIMIDRLIVKQGSIAIPPVPGAPLDPQVRKNILRGIPLPDGTRFVLQNRFSFLSEKEFERLVERGIVQPGRYTLIENPRLTPEISGKLARLAARDSARAFPPELYLIREEALSAFTAGESAALRTRDIRRMVVYVLLVILIFSAQFGASYFQILSLSTLSQKAMRDLRRDLFAHIMSLELSFFDSNPIGKIVNRVTNDIEALSELFSTVLITFLQDALILIGIMVVMFSTNLTLGLAVAVSFPFLIAITFAFRVQARKAYRTIRSRIAAINAYLNENISGIRIVRIFVQEAKQAAGFASINHALFRANMRQVYVYGVFRPLIELFRWCAIAAVIFVGAGMISDGRISYGLVVMFLSYIGTFFEPLGELAEKFDTMQSATAAGEKILHLFTTSATRELPAELLTENTDPAETVPRAAGPAGRSVVFDNVWFSYKPGEWVLKGVSFSVPENRTLAIVGETGSGKTTIASVLARLYSPQKGRILLGEAPIDEIPLSLLRRSVGMVMQDVFLFSRSVADNITLDAPFDRERFEEACRLSHCDRFISSLPHGEAEQVMERGATFSAGERQLLALARALYYDPPVLILDEATSNIDTETEQLIQDAISHLLRGRTSLVIAHRLSTIRSADSIIVLDKGTVVERGNHESLMAAGGIYGNLYMLQFGAV